MPGCPVRYRAGPDRPCGWHGERDGLPLTGRAATYGALLAAAPAGRGERDGGDDHAQ